MNMRRLVCLVLLTLGATLLLSSANAQTTERTVVLGEIRGIINPPMAGYVIRVIDQAEAMNAEAVVLQMDTPGGLVDSMRDINLRILSSQVPIIVYVAPDGARAGSAGVYIAYAAQLAAMAPTTNIGSATPVSAGQDGVQELSPEMQAKVENDAVAQIRALAEQRGRNPDFAEKAVREAANLQASEALRQNVVNYVARDLSDLLRQADEAQVTTAAGPVTLHTADAEVVTVGMSAIEEFLLIVSNPTIAFLLLSLGGLGLMVELYNPGALFPGVAGSIALLLAFYSLGTLPVNYAGLGLLILGLVMFALEPFVTSHGVLAVGGGIAFALGAMLLINVPESAEYLRVSLWAVGGVTLFMVGFSLLAVAAVLRMRRRKVVTGREGMLGSVGIVRMAIEPGAPGQVMVQGELWQAEATGEGLAVGQRVVVVNMDGLLLTVRPSPAGQVNSPGTGPDPGRPIAAAST